MQPTAEARLRYPRTVRYGRDDRVLGCALSLLRGSRAIRSCSEVALTVFFARVLFIGCTGSSGMEAGADGGVAGQSVTGKGDGSSRSQLVSSYNHLEDYCDKERTCDVRPMVSCAGTSYSDEQVARAAEHLTDDEVKRCFDALVAMDTCVLALDCDAYRERRMFTFCITSDAPPARCCFDSTGYEVTCPADPFPCEDKQKRVVLDCEVLDLAISEGDAGVVDAGDVGDGGLPLDPATFAGMHLEEISDDCNKTVQCKGQRGEILRQDDPVGHCVLETAEILNASEAKQATFLANYNRCRSFAVCDYVACAQSGGNTYGDTQRDKIQQMCGAEVECNLVRNLPGDTQEICVEKRVNQLNSYVAAQRDRWEASFTACSSQSGCGFVDCYNAAFFGASGGQ